MAGKKLTVVISQSQGKNPAKRALEEELAAALIFDESVDVSLVPHLYDMSADHTGMMFMRSVPGDLLVLSWLYPRASRWILDRAGIRGHEGVSILNESEEDEDEEIEAEEQEANGIGSVDVPDRNVYCVDLRDHQDPKIYLDEIDRITKENSVQTVDLMQWIQGSPQPEQLQRYLQPDKQLAAIKTDGAEHSESAPEPTKRRWYPVIDYSRCTNCLECLDFL